MLEELAGDMRMRMGLKNQLTELNIDTSMPLNLAIFEAMKKKVEKFEVQIYNNNIDLQN